jgi:hypothetical protein
MGKIDVKSKIKVVELFTTIATTATRTIQGSEVADFLGACFAVKIGAWTADDLTVTFQHRDSTDDSWANITAADLDGSASIEIVTGLANTVQYVGYKGNKRYIGAVITDTGTGDAVVGVDLVMLSPKDIPVNS